MGPRVTQPTSVLVGRERECAQIDDLIEHARAGESGTLVLRGEPGVGKTALLDYADRPAADMLVLRAAGVEGESDLGFSGLYGLVRPILEHRDELPVTQSAALAGALGLAPSPGSDRFLISAAVLGLLAAAAEARPLVCLVDDAQWLDGASADALVFSARRLRADRVAMIFATREGEARRFDAPGLPELMIGGLAEGPAEAVILRRAPDAAPAVLARLLAEAQGNPLALMELPTALSGAQLAGAAGLPEEMPLTPRLQALFRHRIERLPRDTQLALLMAATEETGEVRIVSQALAQLELGADALDPAERGALIRIIGGEVRFRHPLVRSALHEGATLAERRRAHTALATVLTADEHADRRVWHQAMATLEADEDVAAALEASARRAEARGAYSSAATALLRAAELSDDRERGTRRIASAAEAAWRGGQSDRARSAIDRALPVASGEMRVRLLQLSGAIEGRSGSLVRALELLVAAAQESAEPSLTLEMLVDAAEAAVFTGRLGEVVTLGERARSIRALTARDRMLSSLLQGYAKVFVGDHPGARPLLEETIREARSLDDPRALTLAASAASVGGQGGDGLSYARRAVESARQRGLLSELPRALEQLSWELVNVSEFDLAYATAEEGCRLALGVGHGAGWPLMNLALVEAVWGREEQAREHASEVLTIAQRSGSTFLAGIGEWTLGFLELAIGRAGEAATRMLAVTDLSQPEVNPLVALPAIPDAVEAVVRAGQVEQLESRVAAFEAWTAAAPVPARAALLARCHAVLGTRPPDEAFGEAIVHASSLPPLQRARTELLYGEWLRRERRRQDARLHLRPALELFRKLGAEPFAQRAEAELRATGETARRRDPSTLDELTPQELQIAGLVAQGLSNREIAAQLFLSPRTIDYHLRKVFSKRGITSRVELVRQGLLAREEG